MLHRFIAWFWPHRRHRWHPVATAMDLSLYDTTEPWITWFACISCPTEIRVAGYHTTRDGHRWHV